MANTKQKRIFNYGATEYLPQTIIEGQENYDTKALTHTFDTGGSRLNLTPQLDWNETNAKKPSFVRNKVDIEKVLQDIETARQIQNGTHIYGVEWDKTTSSMKRIYDSVGITTDTTNFTYNGSVNQNYNNPFDKIYPWSECKQCNVDLDLYRAQQPGDDIRDAVVAWYGDPDFTTDGSNGFVGRYTPEFWYLGYERDNKKYIFVADKKVTGFLHHEQAIRGHGFAVDDGNDGVTSDDGQPMSNVACSTIHAKAKAGGFTLRDIFEADAETALFMVEFASMDAQAKLGNGCSAGYYSPNFTVLENATGATTVLLPAAAKQYCIPGATLDFANSKDGVVLENRRTIISAVDYGTTYVQVTFDKPLDLTTSMYPSIHGKNNADSIGNKSGYVGTNGKNNAWYRGAIMYANRWQYTLGCYRQTGTSHIWLATPETADDYDAIDTSQHYDTGIKLLTPSANSWQQVGDYTVPNALASIGPITKAATLTGDKQYVVVETIGNTVTFLGGDAGPGTACGVLCVSWYSTAGDSTWGYSAVALLRRKAVTN